MSFMPFLIGTVFFIAAGISGCLLSYPLLKAYDGRKRNCSCELTAILITIATFCMWVMWGFTWLMQLHPLIAPQKLAE